MAKLIVISSEKQQEFELSAYNSIGRHPSNTIQILDRIISKEHAQIQRNTDGVFILHDLHSLNGTFIAGDKISKRKLDNGDEISMGSTRLLFVENSEEPRFSRCKVTISPSLTESHIQQRITATNSEFLPANAIEDNDLVRRDYELLRIGHELAKTISSELELTKLLPKILDKTFELVGADRGVILLMDDDGHPVPRYVKTREGREDNIVLSKTVTNEVLANRAAVLSSDATMDARFAGAQSIIIQGIRSTMTVPLIHGKDILGIMHLDSQITTNAFTEKDLQICTGVASQAAIAIKNAKLAKRIEQEAETRAQISRLIPPSIVEEVMKGQLVLEKGGRLHEITMLFSDIRGFTAMSDGKPPEEVLNTLNEYFEVMVEVLFHHQGTLDKFVGDEIIGLFGAPIEIEDDAYRGICCALDMLKALKEFNQTRKAEGQKPIQIGIGLNTGQVITGAIGSNRALQYTAIGDAMNIASRLCNVAVAGEIIASEHTYKLVANRVEADFLPPVRVKGKAEELRVYKILGIKP